MADVRRALESAAPDRVYPLASQSSVPESLKNPLGILRNNVEGTVNLLEGVSELAGHARVLIVSSSEVYGRARSSSPVDELQELRPENPYAVSKATQDLLGYQYGVARGIWVVRVRPFNHIGPGQSDRAVASSLSRQIAEIEAGRREPVLRVGNLQAQRDFTDVRDMVRAYRLALEQGEAGAAYNIGRGSSVSIQTLLDHLLLRSRVAVEVELDPALLRTVDAPIQLCDNRRFRERTGWETTIPIETSLDDMLGYWRRQLGVG